MAISPVIEGSYIVYWPMRSLKETCLLKIFRDKIAPQKLTWDMSDLLNSIKTVHLIQHHTYTDGQYTHTGQYEFTMSTAGNVSLREALEAYNRLIKFPCFRVSLEGEFKVEGKRISIDQPLSDFEHKYLVINLQLTP